MTLWFAGCHNRGMSWVEDTSAGRRAGHNGDPFVRPGWVALDLREVWAYRELLVFFVWRDIKVRYKQTLLGAGWAILQPVLTMVVFTIFFGRLAKIPSDGMPYPVFS